MEEGVDFRAVDQKPVAELAGVDKESQPIELQLSPTDATASPKTVGANPDYEMSSPLDMNATNNKDPVRNTFAASTPPKFLR